MHPNHAHMTAGRGRPGADARAADRGGAAERRARRRAGPLRVRAARPGRSAWREVVLPDRDLAAGRRGGDRPRRLAGLRDARPRALARGAAPARAAAAALRRPPARPRLALLRLRLHARSRPASSWPASTWSTALDIDLVLAGHGRPVRDAHGLIEANRREVGRAHRPRARRARRGPEDALRDRARAAASRRPSQMMVSWGLSEVALLPPAPRARRRSEADRGRGPRALGSGEAGRLASRDGEFVLRPEGRMPSRRPCRRLAPPRPGYGGRNRRSVADRMSWVLIAVVDALVAGGLLRGCMDVLSHRRAPTGARRARVSTSITSSSTTTSPSCPTGLSSATGSSAPSRAASVGASRVRCCRWTSTASPSSTTASAPRSGDQLLREAARPARRLPAPGGQRRPHRRRRVHGAARDRSQRRRGHRGGGAADRGARAGLPGGRPRAVPQRQHRDRHRPRRPRPRRGRAPERRGRRAPRQGRRPGAHRDVPPGDEPASHAAARAGDRPPPLDRDDGLPPRVPADGESPRRQARGLRGARALAAPRARRWSTRSSSSPSPRRPA